MIEVSSGLVLLWRLNYHGSPEAEERVEARALKLVGVSLMVLAVYVLYDSLKSLFSRDLPETSYTGIGLATLSLIVMPLLARAKRRVATQIRRRAFQADSYQADICAYLSAILLVGLVSNATLGWWWADPVAALAMTPIIVKEGREALGGKPAAMITAADEGRYRAFWALERRLFVASNWARTAGHKRWQRTLAGW